MLPGVWVDGAIARDNNYVELLAVLPAFYYILFCFLFVLPCFH
jgi:hypothetical protein